MTLTLLGEEGGYGAADKCQFSAAENKVEKRREPT